ncbi:MAG: (2Fe-2S)-binding protein [Acidimicrobiales bacterium]|nr:(2Fe-2S)-binding protein [Acidimicrobiales bacterium]
MIVCHCNAVSDREIIDAVRTGALDVDEVGRSCGAGTDCRGCRERIEKIIEFAAPRRPALRAS